MRHSSSDAISGTQYPNHQYPLEVSPSSHHVAWLSYTHGGLASNVYSSERKSTPPIAMPDRPRNKTTAPLLDTESEAAYVATPHMKMSNPNRSLVFMLASQKHSRSQRRGQDGQDEEVEDHNSKLRYCTVSHFVLRLHGLGLLLVRLSVVDDLVHPLP